MSVIAAGDIFALSSAAAFAISSIIMKGVSELGSASQLNFVRTMIGATIFLFHLVISGKAGDITLLSGILLLFLVLSVLFNVVIGDTAFFEAQRRVGAKIATPLVNTNPYLTILLAVLFLGESVNLSLIIGSIIIIPGIILLSFDKIDPDETISENRGNRGVGLLLILVAIVSYSLGILFTTLGTVNVDPVVANSIRLPVGTLGLFMLSSIPLGNNPTSWSRFATNIRHSKRSQKVLLLISGVFGTYMSSFLLVLAVQEIGASRSSILFSTGPLFVLPFALLWLKEKVGVVTLLGTLMTVFGLWIVLT